MRNKGFVVLLAITITLLCVYFLSFTVVSMRIQNKALAQATDKNGTVDLARKQIYIDSIWNLPVYNLFGAEFTYKEIKDNELSFGLDLQGGMHVTLEVSPVDILKGLSGNSQDSSFIQALNKSIRIQKTTSEKFSDIFFRTFQEANPDKKLATIFASATTRGRIGINDSDKDVMKIVNQEIESAIDRSFIILRNRLDQFGTSQPNIQLLPNTGHIQIEIPGADNPQRVRKLLEGVAKLEFWDLADMEKRNTSLIAINDFLVKEQKAAKATETGAATKSENLSTLLSANTTSKDSTKSKLEKELQAAKDSTDKNGLDSLNQDVSPLFALSKSRGDFSYDVKDTAVINSIFKRTEVKSLLRNIGVFWGNKPDKIQGAGEAIELYFIDLGRNEKSKLTGEVITDARLSSDEYGKPAISMTMNTKGTKTWSKMTAEASSKTPKGRIAIVLDRTVYSAPNVINEIPNGNSQISGNFSVEEAKDLANVLKAGSLPAPTRIVEEAIIGPTLGKAAMEQGLVSMACGLAIIALFMIVYYAKSGWVANAALLFNIFFILGVLAQFNAALTLPGIAGIVLTMGMAVDSNVLIYERIKEELRNGRKLRDAINNGYQKAFNSIFDSNVTTFLTAFFLFWLGQGPLKGFAIVLMIGIVTSFFSSVYISRVIIEWMTRKGDESHVSFDTFLAKIVSHRPNFDFIGMRKINYIISISMIVVGFAAIAFQGLNLGVDFKGGRSYIVSFSKPVDATEMKLHLTESFKNASTEVKNYGSNSVVKITTSHLIEEQNAAADETVTSELITGLETLTKLKHAELGDKGLDDGHFSISSSSKVGPTVADDIKNSAVNATLLSLIAIFVYILIRFRKWQYSVGAIIATLHDSLFVVSAFAIAHIFGLNFEVDQIFVAAILTVIGYSLNDTVIIFDRLREYLGLGTNHDRPKLVNEAINSTLSRTLITSGTTLAGMIILLIFGGEVLRGFSFALVVGIVVGTYSSIFIAAPIVLDFDRKEDKKV